MFNDENKNKRITLLHKDNLPEEKRYCSVEESLRQSLKEIKLYKQGKIKLQTWDEYVNEG